MSVHWYIERVITNTSELLNFTSALLNFISPLLIFISALLNFIKLNSLNMPSLIPRMFPPVKTTD